jgi:hypothetical protein
LFLSSGTVPVIFSWLTNEGDRKTCVKLTLGRVGYSKLTVCRDVRPGLAVELAVIDLATADRDTFLRAVRANYGSADHAVAIIIHNAGTIGHDGRKITVGPGNLCYLLISIVKDFSGGLQLDISSICFEVLNREQ